MLRRRSHQGSILQAQVWFHGRLIEDRLIQRRKEPLRFGEEEHVILPPPADRARWAQFQWIEDQVAELRDPYGAVRHMRCGDEWRHREGPVELRLHFQELRPHPFAQALEGSDIGFLITFLAMMVLAVQIQLLARYFMPPPSAELRGMETSPELIARLLQQDYEGAEQGMIEEVTERPDSSKSHPSFYLPAGQRGPLESLGGGQTPGLEIRRPLEPEPAEPSFQPLPPAPAPVLSVSQPDRQAQEDPGPQELQQFQGLPNQSPESEDLLETSERPSEMKEGWGFEDWYDAEDARDERLEIVQEILLARERLRIDPDDAWALQHLAYYQYLARAWEDCEETYQRYIELYPDDPGGYNNLALVYKRTGEYAKEEGYYRIALALNPNDDHALNNLAVNLSHQGRFEEALKIMERLERLIPGDAYAELHRAKIYAEMGDQPQALSHLERALQGMSMLDTLHHIEFRQDIRVDVSFSALRETSEFKRLMLQYYGEEGRALTGSQP